MRKETIGEIARAAKRQIMRSLGLDLRSRSAAIYKKAVSNTGRIDGNGYKLVKYGGDTDTYLTIQKLANAAKINNVFAVEENIATIADYCSSRMRSPLNVLCHGTRNGAEQRWFAKYLGGCEVLGTDVGDTATSFPNTIQWDFHDIKPEWFGAFDVVYSNSWDHARDPKTAFANWMQSLKPTGYMLLEHSKAHGITPDAVDCFLATRDGLVGFVNAINTAWRVTDIIEGLKPDNHERCVLVVSLQG